MFSFVKNLNQIVKIVKIHFSRPGAIPRQGPAISANRIINLIHQQIHHLPHLRVQFRF